MRDHDYWVYMVTNKLCTALYIGMTNDLARRICEHKRGEIKGFTQRYGLNRLVWFDHFREVTAAIACEKGLKGRLRSKKNALIEEKNPRWMDLASELEEAPRRDNGWHSIEEMISDPSLRSG